MNHTPGDQGDGQNGRHGQPLWRSVAARDGSDAAIAMELAEDSGGESELVTPTTSDALTK